MAGFVIGFAIVLLSVGGLALGVIFGREPLRGSCGGLSCIPGTDCAGCPRHRRGAPGE